ncbi:MAG: hypothetical protein WDM77_22050 [Steroidobacteraceae bacterium]
MMQRLLALVTLAATALPLAAQGQTPWTEGRNYFLSCRRCSPRAGGARWK